MTHESDRLDEQRPRSHEFSNHEPSEDGLDLRNAAVTGIGGIGSHQKAGRHGEENLSQKYQNHAEFVNCREGLTEKIM